MTEEDAETVKNVTQDSLVKMKGEIEKAKKKLRQDEEKVEEEMINQEEEIANAEREIKMLKLRLKEKQQVLSLSELKIKEFSRKIRFNSLKPLKRKQKSLDHGQPQQPLTIRNVKRHEELLESKSSLKFRASMDSGTLQTELR